MTTANWVDFWAQVLGASCGAGITVFAAIRVSAWQRTSDAQDLGTVVVEVLRDLTDEMTRLTTALDSVRVFTDGGRTPRLADDVACVYGIAIESAKQRLLFAQGLLSDIAAANLAAMGGRRSGLVQRVRVELESLRGDLDKGSLAPYVTENPQGYPRYFEVDEGPGRLAAQWGRIAVLLGEIPKRDPRPLRQVLPGNPSVR